MGAVIAVELLGDPTLGQASDRLMAEGKQVYLANCAICHGESGNGEGPGAAQLAVKPRDLRTGSFKFRSTVGLSPERRRSRRNAHPGNS